MIVSLWLRHLSDELNFIYYLFLNIQLQRKIEEEKEIETQKYNKCTINGSHNVMHKQLTIVCKFRL